MKYLLKIFLLIWVVAGFVACDKINVDPTYISGIAPVLTSSATATAPLPSDSDKVALTLSWSNTKQATDSANRKYTIEIDSAGKNFSNPATIVVMSALNKSFTAKELNNILLARGYAFNIPNDMEIRMTASYANNNDRLVSNTVMVKMTPYKIPPKVPLPASGKLFIVGDATDGSWSNPVPVPTQELMRIDETTFGGVFNLAANKHFVILPVNGDWSHKYVTNSGGSAGNFGYDLNDDIPGPSTSGMYKVILDFQTGKYTITPYTGSPIPAKLFMVGDATPGSWSNPVPPAQQLTRLNSSQFQIVINLNGGKSFLLLPVNGDWGTKYGGLGGSNQSNNPMGDGFKIGGSDLLSPPTTGNYTLTFSFLTNTYSVK